jgi:hypothetical protein
MSLTSTSFFPFRRLAATGSLSIADCRPSSAEGFAGLASSVRTIGTLLSFLLSFFPSLSVHSQSATSSYVYSSITQTSNQATAQASNSTSKQQHKQASNRSSPSHNRHEQQHGTERQRGEARHSGRRLGDLRFVSSLQRIEKGEDGEGYVRMEFVTSLRLRLRRI